MSNTNTENPMTKQQLVEIRKKLATQIDPETAEVNWCYGEMIMDPYGERSDLPEECRQLGRLYFARNPESDIWISFYDLPDDTVRKLRELHHRNLAFSAEEFTRLLEEAQADSSPLPF